MNAESLEELDRESERAKFLASKTVKAKKAQDKIESPKAYIRNKWWPPSMELLMVLGVALGAVCAMVAVSSHEESPDKV